MTVKRVAKGQFHPFSTDPVWDSISEEAKDVIASCFKVTRGNRITMEGLREHPWLAMDKKAGTWGLTKVELTQTRSKLQENFRGKFKKGVNTIRATLRMQSLKKLTAGLSAAHDLRLKTDSGGSDGAGGSGGGGIGGDGFNAFDSIQEGEEEEEEEKKEGGASGGVGDGAGNMSGSAKKYTPTPVDEPSSSTGAEE